MTVGHPHPPEKVRAGVEAWREGLVSADCEPKLSLSVPPADLRKRERQRGLEGGGEDDFALRGNLYGTPE